MAAYSNYYPYYANTAWGVPYVGQQAFAPYPPQPQVSMAVPQNSQQFMIQVDGEIGAKAWQPQTPLNPNTVIPLWDYDGMHVYFKSTDAYGRMNPVRKAKVVFEDEPQNLPQGNSGSVDGLQNVSGSGQSIELPDMTRFVTKDDLESFKADLRSMFTAQAQREHQSGAASNPNTTANQNGNGNSGRGNRA